MTMKADLHRRAYARAMPVIKQEPHWPELLKLPREDQIAELMSLNWLPNEIADALGYKNRRVVNAAIQRIRNKIGEQAQ